MKNDFHMSESNYLFRTYEKRSSQGSLENTYIYCVCQMWFLLDFHFYTTTFLTPHRNDNSLVDKRDLIRFFVQYFVKLCLVLWDHFNIQKGQ